MTPTVASALPETQAPSRTRRRWILGTAVSMILIPVLFASLWPVTFDSREELFEIPKGTWARHMAGDKHEYLPSTIYLMVGIHNVLIFRNSDEVPQFFGPTLLMPGQSLRIPFTRPSENSFSCTAHASGQLLIEVAALPTWPWERLSWRAGRMLRWLSGP